MERIIINEVDNTSNVEALSSYDVAYVPGFATTESAMTNLFRTPTLFTDKYKFSNAICGDNSVPTFSEAQSFPIASEGTYGFPEYAIPNGSTVEYGPVDEPTPIITNIPFVEGEDESVTVTNTGVYTLVDETSTPDDDKYYYYVDYTSSITNFIPYATPNNVVPYTVGETSYQTLFEKDNDTYTETEDDEVDTTKTYYKIVSAATDSDDAVYAEVLDSMWESLVIPVEANWAMYEKEDNGNLKLTSDTSVDISKTYYGVDDTESAYVIVMLGKETSTGNYKDSWAEYDYSSDSIYEAINPNEIGWYIPSTEEVGIYVRVTDDHITPEFLGARPVSKYYEIKSQEDTMIEQYEVDLGYRYALYLLSLGMPVYYEVMNNTVSNEFVPTESIDKSQGIYGITVNSMYDGLMDRFAVGSEPPVEYSFDSIGDYSIKYITSGGYPTFEYGLLSVDTTIDDNDSLYVTNSPLAIAMIDMAYQRKESIALIDHTNNPQRPLTPSEPQSVVARIREEFASLTSPMDSYGTMFTPWFECSHSAITGTSLSADATHIYKNQVPGSLGFLTALAQQLKNYNPWLAVSGVTRGRVPNCSSLHTNNLMTNNVADSYQVMPYEISSGSEGYISINPITYIRNYGYCIWGNRTLRNNKGGTIASSFLNIRNLVSDIKKTLYEASQSLMFEQNSDVLWINFKSKLTPLLDTMVSNYILSDYNIIKYNVNPETGEDVPAYELMAAIRIVPINSVEVFDLTVYIDNREVTVAEQQ